LCRRAMSSGVMCFGVGDDPIEPVLDGAADVLCEEVVGSKSE
jgi:hypothetical protein